MKHQGDSSIFKSLAVAFGDGLAFGVGVMIAQVSSRKRAEAAPAELAAAPMAAPVAPPAPPAAVEAPAESLDLQLLSKVLASIDAKLVQHMGKVEQRLAQSEIQMGADLKALDNKQAQQSSRSQAALEEIHGTLTERVKTAEREAQSVESRVAGFIESVVESRVQVIEERLHRDIVEAGDRTAKLLVQTIETKMLARIETLEAELRSQADVIRSLRAEADGSRQRLHETLEGIGRVCQEAVRKLETQPETAGPGGSEPTSSAVITGSPAEAETEDRRFDSLKLVNYQVRSERKLPIPLVSSIAVFLLGMATLGSSVSWF
jgi:hypothetical protein